jgi:hypothetical protein
LVFGGDGSYQVLVPPGRYWLATELHTGPWVPMAHPGVEVSCAWEDCDLSAGQPIVVSDQNITGIDLELRRGARARGRVTDTDGNPLFGLRVLVWDGGGRIADVGRTDADGRYVTSSGLPPGTYTVSTAHFHGYEAELHDGLPCTRGYCTPQDGTPVVVGQSGDVTVDFELEPGSVISGQVTTEGDDLPLFGLLVQLYHPSGEQTAAQPVDHDGSYWISGLRPGTYYAQTVNNGLPVDNEVYRDIFCGGVACDTTVGEPIEIANDELRDDVDIELGLNQPCDTIGSDLCVQGRRFHVAVRWQTATDSGDASVFPLTGDTGAFWFFGPANLEIMVKVLDGCAINDRFWVFAAGLTDVGVTITVTDTWTGDEKVYTNNRGTAFPTITDTAAFRDCPF